MLKERLILKERRALIDKGTGRTSIKIRNDSLYIDNKLHCKISNDGSKLEFVSNSVQLVVDASITNMESSWLPASTNFNTVISDLRLSIENSFSVVNKQV